MQLTHFSKNGTILPIDQAVIPLTNIEYSYGFGVYETVRVKHGTVYFVKQHIERLFSSAGIIGLTHSITYTQIEAYIADLIRALKLNPTDSCNLKILLIGGEEPLLFILPLRPFFPTRSDYKNGIKTITVEYERQFPKAKTLNMLPSFLAYKKAKKEGCYDALAVTKDGIILEGTRTNFFAIKKGTIFMPRKENILDGVTMMTVLHVARKHGYRIEERDLYKSEISEYDGAFLTSTSSKIMPISSIDSHTFPSVPEEITDLMKLYDSFLEDLRGEFSPDTRGS